MIRVLVISLPSAVRRRAAVQENFTGLGIPFSFFDAVDGRTLTAEQIASYDPQPYIGHSNRKLVGGEIGCTASFHAVLQQVAAGDDPFVCVAEDDCCFAPEALHFLDEAVLRSLPEFDVLRLINDPTPRSKSLARFVRRENGHDIVAPLRAGFFTIAQIFSRAGAAKIAPALIPIRAPLDNFLYRDAGILGLRVLEVLPGVADGHGAPSTIGARVIPRSGSKRAWSLVIGRKFFLLRRRVRGVRSFAAAWGWSALAELRPLL